MNRRHFVAAACSFAAFAAESMVIAQPWTAPPRFVRPDPTTDEGGLWAIMDREESRLKYSPLLIRDPGLRQYVHDVACHIAGEHCPDLRVYILRAPVFNASMAPNGMLIVFSGALLRVDNEAQLAAVLGHETGHYLQRHVVEHLRDVKSRSAFAQFLGALGLVGAIGQLGMLASAFAYTREQERDADRVGLLLMHAAGYDSAEAAKVWENLLVEVNVRRSTGAEPESRLASTHPVPEDRLQAMRTLAASMQGGTIGGQELHEKTQRFRRQWLFDEGKRGSHDETIALTTRMLRATPDDVDVLYARGEAYRRRAQEPDFNAALDDLNRAVAVGNEPPETHRAMALIYRARSRTTDAISSFERYLALAPKAPDAPMIKGYLEELER